jgi:hypothetical protein
MKIIGYRVWVANSIGNLNDDINEMIRQGWQPFGEFKILTDSLEETFRYYQTLVMYEGICDHAFATVFAPGGEMLTSKCIKCGSDSSCLK